MTEGEQIYSIGEVIWNREVSAGETATFDSKNYINLVIHIESNQATTITLDAVSVNGEDFIPIDEIIHTFTSAGSVDYDLAKILTKKLALKYRYLRFKTSASALIKIIVSAKFGVLESSFDAIYDENTSKHSLIVSRAGGKETFSEEYTSNQTDLVIIAGEAGYIIQVVGVYVAVDSNTGVVEIDYEDGGQKIFRVYASKYQHDGEDDFAYRGAPGKGVVLTSTTGDNKLFVVVNYRKIAVEE